MWKPLLFIAALAMATSAQAASPRDQLVVTPAWLASHAGDKDLVILHVGSEAGYNARHIPGAKILPYTSVTNADGTLKSPEELKAMFSAAGVKPGDNVVVYCQVGGQSGAVAFAARTVGLQPQLYDGSFQDWSKRKLPAETSSAPDK